MTHARVAGFLGVVLVAGCSAVHAPAPPAPAATPVPTPAAPVAASPPSRKEAAPSVASMPPAAAKPSAPAAAKPSAPAAAPPRAPAPLDLKALEQQLRQTKAIGVMTKIAIKNQVDDLLAQFRAFYEGRQKTTLAELRRPYELLMLKVLSLLQDGDPTLARAIHDSREAIWGILADRNKFLSVQS